MEENLYDTNKLIDAYKNSEELNNELRLATKDKHFLSVKEVRSDFEVEVE